MYQISDTSEENYNVTRLGDENLKNMLENLELTEKVPIFAT